MSRSIISNDSIFNTAGGSTTTGSSSAIAGPIVSAIGDSQLALGISVDANNSSYVDLGVMTWARRFSEQSIQAPFANNHAVGGTTWGAAATQLPLALADNPDFIVMNWGTNDSQTGNTGLATAITALSNTIKTCFSAGVIPIIMAVPPRSDAGGTTAAFQWIESYNNVLRGMCAARADLVTLNGLPLHKTPILIDVKGYPDYTATNGTCNVGMIGSDSLHKTTGGGCYDGDLLANIIAKIRPTSSQWMSTPYDIYDSTNLINGSLMNFSGVNNGMFQGTGGTLVTNGGITPTGNVADHWKLLASNTISSTGTTVVGQKENPRQDGFITGERQRITITSTGGAGGTNENFRLSFNNGVQGIRLGFAAGDIIKFSFKAQILNAINFQGITATVQESGPASPQTFQDGSMPSNLNVGLSSAQYPQLLRTQIFETPPMTLRTGIVDILPYIDMQMYGAGSNYLLDVIFSDARVVKIVPN